MNEKESTGMPNWPGHEWHHKKEKARSAAATFIGGLLLLVGIYLTMSPWITRLETPQRIDVRPAGLGRALGVDVTTVAERIAVNNVVIGVVIAVLGLGLAVRRHHYGGIVWVLPLLGVWEIISPWVTGQHTTGIILNNVIAGVMILFLGMAAKPASMGGGHSH
jgi:hypothetical protein